MTIDLRAEHPAVPGSADPAGLGALIPPGLNRYDAVAADHGLVREVRRAVSEQLAERLQQDPVADPSARRELCRALLAEDLSRRARALVRAGQRPWPVEQEMAIAQSVMAALFGMGRLQPLIDDPDVENIEVDGCDQVWISYADGRDERGPAVAESDAELIEQLQLLAARTGSAERTFSSANPRLHLRLDDGSRLAAMAWTTPRPYVVIRRHRVRDVNLADMVRLGTLDTALAAFLGAGLRAGKNIVVTGLQNVGKTTLVRALASEFDPMERFATIEKEYELHLHSLPERHPRVVPMEAREGSSEKDAHGDRAGEVTLRDLVNDALRMNLRRIIVGEVRGEEILPMLDAMSTGDGSMCTLHARTAHHAIDRAVTLCLASGNSMTDAFAYRLVAGSVDLVVHLTMVDRLATGGPKHRFVSHVLEINGLGEGSRPVTTTVFGPGADGRAVPLHHPAFLEDYTDAGFDPAFLDHKAGTWARPLDHGDRR
ncbi:Pilus assembly protein, ATPase of CpaF family [Sanguibacter gelidistatuariae]|uniref:Pilus assembly protein, ATPase of CpaF family n=1 Tax=Sanguibacter gelidistatuariae TaxID=1814289 RepID=A0A1G6T2B2_9MICO|nr:ATPase, T2SS/T4P/T4SS family [Sanguibacter gelidistatuariae]SDD23103.1 Pilus assembly protein, ATPase of CpaF family [Sanguibacter gelidistatuariae]